MHDSRIRGSAIPNAQSSGVPSESEIQDTSVLQHSPVIIIQRQLLTTDNYQSSKSPVVTSCRQCPVALGTFKDPNSHPSSPPMLPTISGQFQRAPLRYPRRTGDTSPSNTADDHPTCMNMPASCCIAHVFMHPNRKAMAGSGDRHAQWST